MICALRELNELNTKTNVGKDAVRVHDSHGGCCLSRQLKKKKKKTYVLVAADKHLGKALAGHACVDGVQHASDCPGPPPNPPV